jgi:hypothetical protein
VGTEEVHEEWRTTWLSIGLAIKGAKATFLRQSKHIKEILYIPHLGTHPMMMAIIT